MNKPRVAFLGLGIMGGGMTRRLLGAGYPVSVYNRNRAKAEALGQAGATVATSPREAATGAQFVFSMVADDDASRAMWLGSEGALAGAARGTVMIESSTLTVGWVNELAKVVAAAGSEFVDAPVAGSKQAAADGELIFIVGASDATLEKVRPLLTTMGRKIAHVGGTGAGALVKLVNNFMAGVQVAAMAEAFGIDKGAISRQVQHLVDLGLAERLPDPEDRRAALVAATPEALERLTANSARRLGVLDARLAAWDDAKLAGFVEMLAHYNAMLTEPISLADEPDANEPADPEGQPARLS